MPPNGHDAVYSDGIRQDNPVTSYNEQNRIDTFYSYFTPEFISFLVRPANQSRGHLWVLSPD
jgi:hypothetical protein